MTRAEVIIQNMQDLMESYEQAEKDGELKEVFWWENEFGMDLTDMIDCHVIFKGEPPCLLDERGLNRYNTCAMTKEEKIEHRCKCDAACAECKAIWLMGEYE